MLGMLIFFSPLLLGTNLNMHLALKEKTDTGKQIFSPANEILLGN